MLEKVARLKATFQGLQTFEGACAWDAQAAEAVDALAAARDDLLARLKRAEKDHREAERARASLPFFKRLFATKRHVKAALAAVAQLQAEERALGEAGDELLQMIDYTPNDKKDQKTILKELRATKKELQLAKREITSKKREINAAARQASASAGHGFFMYHARTAAYERRQIRLNKEAEIAPYENAASAIERQMRDVERRILWVERFGIGPDEDA